MLHIVKRTAPREIQQQVIEIKKSEEWKRISGEDTESIRHKFDLLDKDLIRKNIRVEQHGLCAYCMRKLPKAIDGRDNFTIEHYKTIGIDPKLSQKVAPDYDNKEMARLESRSEYREYQGVILFYLKRKAGMRVSK